MRRLPLPLRTDSMALQVVWSGRKGKARGSQLVNTGPDYSASNVRLGW